MARQAHPPTNRTNTARIFPKLYTDSPAGNP